MSWLGGRMLLQMTTTFIFTEWPGSKCLVVGSTDLATCASQDICVLNIVLQHSLLQPLLCSACIRNAPADRFVDKLCAWSEVILVEKERLNALLSRDVSFGFPGTGKYLQCSRSR